MKNQAIKKHVYLKRNMHEDYAQQSKLSHEPLTFAKVRCLLINLSI